VPPNIFENAVNRGHGLVMAYSQDALPHKKVWTSSYMLYNIRIRYNFGDCMPGNIVFFWII
jgi:hypothetical protein